jgi:hypothetical protein
VEEARVIDLLRDCNPVLFWSAKQLSPAGLNLDTRNAEFGESRASALKIQGVGIVTETSFEKLLSTLLKSKEVAA